MKDYNGIVLLNSDFRFIKIIEKITGESVSFTSFYQDNGIDEINIFNAFLAEKEHIINLMLTLPILAVPEELTELKALETLFIEGNGRTLLPKSLET